MRRPAAVCAAGLTAGIAVRKAAGAEGFAVMTAGFLLFCFALKCKKIENKEIKYNSGDDDHSREEEIFRRGRESAGRRLAVFLFVLCFLTGGLRYGLADGYISVFDGMDGETVTVSGRVLSASPQEDGAVLIIDAVPESPAPGEDGKKRTRREKLQVTVRNSGSGQSGGGGDEGADRNEAEKIRSLTGWYVTVTGAVYRPAEAGNPKGFDYAQYLRTRGIRMTMYAEWSKLQCGEKPAGLFYILERLAALKSVFLSQTESHMDAEAAALLSGIMFGDKNDLDEAEYEDFQKNGIAHLLAVSGMHISMIYGILNVAFRNPSGLAGNLPIAVILAMYAAMCGFSPSVVRAVIMIYIHIAAKITFRRYDFLSSISVCAFCMMIYRPDVLFAAGFQLSFLAVLTLGIVMPKGGGYRHAELPEDKKKHAEILPEKHADGRKRRLYTACRDQVQGTVLMQLGMVPLSLYHFHYISIGAFFLNIPAIALSDLIVPAGTALIPLSVLAEWIPISAADGDPAEFLLAAVCRTEEMLLSALTDLNALFADTPLSYRYMASPPDAVFFLYYFILFFLCSEAGLEIVRKSAKKAAVILAAGALVCLTAGIFLQQDMMRADMIFVDVGQGDCAHLKADGGTDLMFDSGGSDTYDVGKKTLIPYFLAGGVSDIDLAVISHLHQDHCGGLRTMTEGVKVKKLLLSAVYEPQAESIAAEFGIPRENMIFAAAGDVLTVGGAKLTVLKPDRADEETYRRLLQDSEDENRLSLIVRVEYRKTSVLFTGDIGEPLEKELAEQYAAEGPVTMRSDILKVAHHGSRYSSCEAFLSAAAPKAAVIQVGRNYYGHPAQETIQRLSDAGAEIFRNDLHGAILFRFGENLSVDVLK